MHLTRRINLLLLALLPLAPVPAWADNNAAPTAGIPDHLVVRDVKLGDGAAAQVGNMIQVQYTGWIYDAYAPDHHGKQFDSSAGRGPFSFMLGVGSVIKGWDRGVAGMKVGGKRTLVIPPNLAYGERGAGQDIPPGSTLVFDIELVKVE